MTLLTGIFEAGVETCEMDTRHLALPLHPDERIYVSAAVEGRRREFACGRACARVAMRRLGLPDQPILAGADRAPVWPPGVVGSISHCGTTCGAAIALANEGFQSIGLDIDDATPLDANLVQEICFGSELAWLDMQAPDRRAVLAKIIFSAKECAYKAQYPLSRTLFGFDAMRVTLDAEKGCFVAAFERDVSPFAAGDRLEGRVRVSGGLIATGIAIRQ